MARTKHLVVIGGGIAGVSAAQAARHEYPFARITLHGGENAPFYNRIALGSVVTGKMREEHLRVFTPSWLENQRIQAYWNTAVESVDTGSHQVVLPGGQTTRYDKLILATGAVPAVPEIRGVDNPSVLRFWSLQDALRIRERLVQTETVAIIGGGVLGVEMAVDLNNIGKRVTLIESQPAVLPLHLSPPAAEAHGRFLESVGIRLELGLQITAIDSGPGTHSLVAAGGRTIESDLVLLMAGVEPDVALARAAGLDIQQGIVVDSHMQTSDPDVLACGNCVEALGGLGALWNSARSQGETAGQNAFGRRKPWPASELSIHLKTPQMPLFVCGQKDGRAAGARVIEERSETTYRELHFDNQGRIRYAVFSNETAGAHLIEQALGQGTRLPEEVLGAESVDGVIEELDRDELARKRSGDDHQVEGWTCQMCGYVHEGEHPPEICPVCNVGKDQFMAA